MATVTEILLSFKDSDQTNPVNDEGMCVYTLPEDRTQHCIAGQAWINLGGNVEMLTEGTCIQSNLLGSVSDACWSEVRPIVAEQVPDFTVEDALLLGAAQQLADGFDFDLPNGDFIPEYRINDRRSPRPWKQVVAVLQQVERLPA